MMYRDEVQRDSAPSGPTPIIFEAIVRTRCVGARYNGGDVVLAPHVIYTRHGELYVGAITVERDGKPPREPKLGIFKLDGLNGLSLTERTFEMSPLFDPADSRFSESTLLKVEA